MPSDTKSINVGSGTKERAQGLLRKHFPPGSADWAVFDAIFAQGLELFERGEMTVFGVTLDGRGSAMARNRPDSALRDGRGSAMARNRPDSALRAARSGSEGSSATPTADAPSEGVESEISA